MLSALALYCLEKENMEAVLHTGMDAAQPWLNRSIRSKTREDILQSAGSRYAPSSPCEALRTIEEARRPCVFIGKPCDAAAVYAMRRGRKKLDERLGLSLSFFCAGPPATKATLDFIGAEGIDRSTVTSISYRGNGWPGNFEVRYNGGQAHKTFTYQQSWGHACEISQAFSLQHLPRRDG